MKRRLAWAGIWLAIGAILWLPMTSVALCFFLKVFDRNPPWVVPIAAYLYWRQYGSVPEVAHWLRLCAGGAGLLAIAPAYCALFWPYDRRLRVARPGEKPPPPRRAHSDVHGSADWMGMKEARQHFAGPHPDWGGVVVGEAYRVDQDKAAGPRFDPANPKSWGQGGKSPLLVDPCVGDATHGLVLAGSGGFKTTGTTVPSLDPQAGWRGPAVVFDPSCQVGSMTASMREVIGQRVVMLGPGQDGFNALDWIDPGHLLAEAHVRSVVDTIGPEPGGAEASAENGMFKTQGKNLQLCLLADMLWDPAIPKREKTLKTFAARMATPEDRMKGLLQDIHEGSASSLARTLAGTLMGIVPKTFSGIYSNAIADIQWLMIGAYADMVSGADLGTGELAEGEVTVYVQIPLSALADTPELGQTVINALLNGIYRREGQVANRILFLIDEAKLLGRMKALATARDNARKYGVTLVTMWQSLGQLHETWGKAGTAAWMESSSWQLFAAVTDNETAKEVSSRCGTYTVLAHTENASTGSQSGGSSGSTNRGRSEGRSEQSRELIKPAELLQRMRTDEQIVFRRGGSGPLRCGRAIYFRRPEMAARINQDRYRQAAE